MDLKDLKPELIEKAKGMSIEELHALAVEEGVPISDDELEQVAGGWSDDDDKCSKGGKHDWVQTDTDFPLSTIPVPIYTCTQCGATHRGRI